MESRTVIEKGQKLQVVEYDDKEHFAGNKDYEIVVGENASFEMYRIQNLDDDAALTQNFNIKQLRDSRVHIVVISFNGGDLRNNITINIDGEGCETNVYGLYLTDRKQHVENNLKVNHNVPHCSSFTKFKGIVDDEASAVFNGHVYVAPGAQKTDAQQNNSNILLTSTAKINTQPFLEIYADDVKCNHGATVGQLDEQALFYMQQRGIPYEEARMLMKFAFIGEVVDHVSFESFAERLRHLIEKRICGELPSCGDCKLCK